MNVRRPDFPDGYADVDTQLDGDVYQRANGDRHVYTQFDTAPAADRDPHPFARGISGFYTDDYASGGSTDGDASRGGD